MSEPKPSHITVQLPLELPGGFDGLTITNIKNRPLRVHGAGYPVVLSPGEEFTWRAPEHANPQEVQS
jgi:hypothetical protein